MWFCHMVSRCLPNDCFFLLLSLLFKDLSFCVSFTYLVESNSWKETVVFVKPNLGKRGF